MNKDFSKNKLLEMSPHKQIRILFDLATFIESNNFDISSSHFAKLDKYHQFLAASSDEYVNILNKEFYKVKAIDYQFQLYLMNLERFVGQSSKEYQFLINKNDDTRNNLPKFEIKVVLDSVRSAHNIGSITRNCECFNIEELIITGLSPSIEHPQVIKTSMGCDQLVKWRYHEKAVDIITDLKSSGYDIWAIETLKNAINIHKVSSRPKKVAIVFGHEQFGISNEIINLCDKFVDINLYGQKNSLNVATSNAVILNHLTNLPE